MVLASNQSLSGALWLGNTPPGSIMLSSFSGLGRCPFKAEIVGSNPIESAMRIRLEVVPARVHTPFYVGSSPTSAIVDGALAHLVERNAGSVEVAGSIPAGSIIH